MLSIVRRVVAVGALVVASATTSQAQLRVEEIRLDVAQFVTQDGFRMLGVGAPGLVAIAIYLNDNLAIEPSVFFNNMKFGDLDAQNAFGLGVFAPYYFAGDRGRNGLFVAPGVEITKFGDDEAGIDFGADFGLKKAMSDKVSWRVAAGIRTGDSTEDKMQIQGTFGFGIFFR